MPKINECGEVEFNFGVKVTQNILTGELTVWCDEPEIPIHFVWREWMHPTGSPVGTYEHKKLMASISPRQIFDMVDPVNKYMEGYEPVTSYVQDMLDKARANHYNNTPLQFPVERTPGVAVSPSNAMKKNTDQLHTFTTGTWCTLPNGQLVVWDQNAPRAYFEGLIDAGISFYPPIEKGYELWQGKPGDVLPKGYLYSYGIHLDSRWRVGSFVGCARHVSEALNTVIIVPVAPWTHEWTLSSKNYATTASTPVMYFDIEKAVAKKILEMKAAGISIKVRLEEIR